ncbi:MAG: hypothetical protein MJA27_04370, partial [Pseudanabaenales cyanobacterium]|nr:hypothetical protein [Pseudanabaenales cyanobacterium]
LAFSMRLLQTAKNLCQQELDAGNFCLLVKKFNYITVWKEKQLEHPEKSDLSAIAPSLTQQSQKAKPVPLKDPELLIAEQLAQASPPKFPAKPSPPPAVKQRSEDSNSTLTTSKTHAVPKRTALAQENGPKAKPIELANGKRTDQSIPSSKSLKKTSSIPPPATSPPKVEQPADLDPIFLEHCEQALAYCIGPIASFIVEEVFAKNPPSSPNQLIDSLAKEIPNPQAAHEFRNRLKSR